MAPHGPKIPLGKLRPHQGQKFPRLGAIQLSCRDLVARLTDQGPFGR
jgi:hypothetical protein